MCELHRFNRLALFALVAMIAWGSPSHAHRMIQTPGSGHYYSATAVQCDAPGGFAHWWRSSVPFNLQVSTKPPFQAAMTTWNNVTGASHTLTESSTGASYPTNSDGINSVTHLPIAGVPCSGSCLAVTVLYVFDDTSGTEIQEADIYFPTSDPTQFDFQAVATHEFGHALGIHHTEVTSTPRPTMYASYFGSDGRSLESDDVQALRCSEDWYFSPTYEGLHESTNCREIKGWARNNKRPNGAATVQIRYDNLSWDDVVADKYRSDVGYHGYSKTPSSTVRNGRYHTITVRYPNDVTSAGSPQSIICQVGIFKNQTPASFIDTLGKKWSVGNIFYSEIPGYVTHLRYYKAAEEAGVHRLKLWTMARQELGYVDVDFGTAGTAGWKTAKLSGNGVAISANTNYMVTVTTATRQSKTDCGFSTPIVNGPIHGTGGGWVEGDGIFPTNGSCSNFWTDIYFDQ